MTGSLPLINPKPEERGVYQWQTSDDQGQGEYICQMHYSSHGSYIYIYIIWHKTLAVKNFGGFGGS